MISIIICSRNADISDDLKQNISETIGVEYELIVIDNSKNSYSIFSAYNEGVRRAKYPYLCFMHDDILYHTDNWGTKVIEHFKDEKIGLIGVIGGHYMPKCPASWWSAESRSGQIIQGFINEKNEYDTELYKYTNNKKSDCEIIEVASIDGLWFCIPKQSFFGNDAVRFDELLKGFHCYDNDISFQVIKSGKKTCVCYDIFIEHFSYGIQDKDYYNQRKLVHKKWESFLPILKGVEMSNREEIDRTNFVLELNKLIEKNLKLENDLLKIKKSYAYKIGKFLLKPFSYIRNFINQ